MIARAFSIAFAAAIFLATGARAAPRTAGDIAAERLAQAPDLSPRMKAIFAADQADRHGGLNSERMMKADAARQKETAALLAADKLSSAADDEAAAFVFQHGSTVESFLLAHTLAMTAMAKGRTQAAWIAAASLDRYLVSSGQPQIFGTQFLWTGGSWNQGSYNRTMVPESLLRDLGVPSPATQEAQLKAMNTKPDR